MTVSDIITRTDALKPNGYTVQQKLGWLNTVEGRVQVEIHLVLPQDIISYNWEEDQSAVPLLPPPYDEAYLHYLCAMIDFFNGDYDRYQNTMQMCNELTGAYTRWYVTHR